MYNYDAVLKKLCLSTVSIAQFEDNTFAYIQHPENVDLAVDPKLLSMVILAAEELDFRSTLQGVWVGLRAPQGAPGLVGVPGTPRVGPQPPQITLGVPGTPGVGLRTPQGAPGPVGVPGTPRVGTKHNNSKTLLTPGKASP